MQFASKHYHELSVLQSVNKEEVMQWCVTDKFKSNEYFIMRGLAGFSFTAVLIILGLGRSLKQNGNMTFTSGTPLHIISINMLTCLLKTDNSHHFLEQMQTESKMTKVEKVHTAGMEMHNGASICQQKSREAI